MIEIPGRDRADARSRFGQRLAGVFADRGHLCVGVDPHRSLLTRWDLPDTAEGVREFGLKVVAAASASVGMIKPQVAFFERFGSAGYLALEDVLLAARETGLMVIADVKRGDIGTSVDAYAHAWLTRGSGLECDAMTASAYQGVGSLANAMAFAEASGKGIFVLAGTSNPEAALIQAALVQRPSGGEMSVARAIIEDVAIHNRQQWAASGSAAMGSVGVVLGATADLVSLGIDTAADSDLAGIPVLAPGFGHQGAQVRDLHSVYGLMSPAVIVTESRSILSAGPGGIVDAVARRASEVAEAIG